MTEIQIRLKAYITNRFFFVVDIITTDPVSTAYEDGTDSEFRNVGN